MTNRRTLWVRGVIVCVLCAISLVAAPAAGVGLGEPFDLAVGSTTTIGRLKIGFDGVPSDGRCPIGLLCLWEGDAACLLMVGVPDTGDPATVTVHTSTMFGRSATIAGHTITLVELNPYPVWMSPPPPDSYIVTLTVTLQTSTPVEPSTWGRIKALYSTGN